MDTETPSVNHGVEPAHVVPDHHSVIPLDGPERLGNIVFSEPHLGGLVVDLDSATYDLRLRVHHVSHGQHLGQAVFLGPKGFVINGY
jgi:hypothetical protein